MDKPKSFDSLFDRKIFRVPDFQRGYAWIKEQRKDFWEDLINLSDGRFHYTGVLTLKKVDESQVRESDKEYWLVEDHNYHLYHIVDGQQRLTTFVIFLQAFIEFVRGLPENSGRPDSEIFIADTLSISEIAGKYLFKVKPSGDNFRTYKFGYTEDNPSYEYLRYRILGEEGAGAIDETFYTLNLKNAKEYFSAQLAALYEEAGKQGLQDVYKRLTKQFLFNEYVIQDEFDVFVAFETMNNRGKRLSDLELLKNRLIYLTTLYSDNELDPSDRRSFREDINGAWKEVYYQLGRNEKSPLNDDEFLRAHWIMYFKYSRKTGRDYIKFLLDKQFSPQFVLKKTEREVPLTDPEEPKPDLMLDESDDENGDELEDTYTVSSAELQPSRITSYVHSLKESADHWFNSYFPNRAGRLPNAEIKALERLNRIGMGYFRPLVMSILKNEPDSEKRIHIFQRIERFIFLAFRMGNARGNYGSSEFYIAARQLDRHEISLSAIEERLSDRLSFMFDSDGSLHLTHFYSVLEKKFAAGSGYYGWYGVRYFLFEYEMSLLNSSRQKKVDWTDLQSTPRDHVSIEHVSPQTPTPYWKAIFSGVSEEVYNQFCGSLGNLLLLSSSINSSLQNDSFEDKKRPRYNEQGSKIRNGYSDGSHSEIEVAEFNEWGPSQIRERGLKLLGFLEERWEVSFRDINDKEKLLFLPSCNQQPLVRD